MTLRSNHYRVYVPPEWQVVEQGGDSEIPTLLRIPAAAEGVPGVELRLYPWLAEGPLADPTGDALKRLADAGILLGDAARLEDEGPPCPAQNLEFFVFGKPARTIHVLTGTGRAGVITAGHAYGSLVGIVALATSNRPTCAEVQTMVAAIRRLTITLAATGDASRPWCRRRRSSTPGTDQPIDLLRSDPAAAALSGYSQPAARAARSTAAPQAPAATSSSMTPHAARQLLGPARGPRLDLVEQPEQQTADDQRGPRRRRGDPGDQHARDLVDADDLRVLDAEAALDAARRPDADGGHDQRRGGDGERTVRADQQVERDRARSCPRDRACTARGRSRTRRR